MVPLDRPYDSEDRPRYDSVDEVVPGPDGGRVYVQSRYEEPGHSDEPDEAYIHMTRPLSALLPGEELVLGPTTLEPGTGGDDGR